MSKRLSATLVRTKAVQFDMRVWFLQVNSFFLSVWLVATAFGATAQVLAAGASPTSGILAALLVAGVASTSWVVSTLIALMFGAKSKVSRGTWAWIVALLAGVGAGVGVLGVAGGGGIAAAVALGLGVVLTPLLRKWLTWIERLRMTTIGMPVGLLEASAALPATIPPRVSRILDIALRDWQDLRDLLAHPNVLGRGAHIVDVPTLRLDADRALSYMLERTPVVSKLEQLAGGSAELAAKQAADLAVSRFSRAGQTLHEAVRAASKLAASEDQDEAYVLKAKVDGLQELAAGLKAADEEMEEAFESLESEFQQMEEEESAHS